MTQLSDSTNNTFFDNPIIYHLITDRFLKGVPERSHSYGRSSDDDGDVGTFHGGDFRGVTMKLKDGWFSKLGVNGLLISAPYEQIHGWVPGGNGEFKHYAYHGYYALDYTVLDDNFGTENDLKELIATAHGMGIRVILDIAMNHPGYEDPQTLHDLQIDVLRPNWEQASPANQRAYIDYESSAFGAWWGGDWVRAPILNYPEGGMDRLTKCLWGLPDFRTESAKHVDLPTFLQKKERTKASHLSNTTVRGYLIKWLTDWVRNYGVDGFRCDSAIHVELDAWLELKRASLHALNEWKVEHSCEKVDESPFWMMGEAFGSGTSRNSYFLFGFDSLLNFQFQHDLRRASSLEDVFDPYAATLGGRPGYNVVSFISSHDTELFDRSDLIRGGTALMLAPGGVQIFYGDETGRALGRFTPGDPLQGTRSDMNWDAIDTHVLSHWQALGQFRRRHIAVARGKHRKISGTPYIFGRMDEATGDKVVIVIGAFGEVAIPVDGYFSDGEYVRDAYSGYVGRVDSNLVTLLAGEVVLLERVDARLET